MKPLTSLIRENIYGIHITLHLEYWDKDNAIHQMKSWYEIYGKNYEVSDKYQNSSSLKHTFSFEVNIT